MNRQNFISSRPVPSLSFDETVEEVTKQLETETLEERGYSRPQISEICMIIAEIYLRNPKGSVRIGGELLDTSIVQQVFRKLTADHVNLVLDNFSRTTALIRNKKQYLRAALYNSVFEMDSHFVNLVAHNSAGAGK